MEIGEAKKALQQLRHAHNSSEKLCETREALARELTELKETIAEKTLQQRRLQSYNKKGAEVVASALANDLRHMEKLKRELKELDLLLELHGEDKMEAIKTMQEGLIAALSERSEEAKTLFETLATKQTHSRALLEEVNRFQKAFQAFRHHIEEGAELLIAPPKRGILGYLFGRNPKALLAEHIHVAAAEARRLLEQLKHLREERIYREFHPFLEAFIEDAQRPWNQSLYNKKFVELHRNFSKLWAELEKEKRRLEHAIEESTKAVDELIDRFCTGV